MKILFLAPRLPLPADTGGKIRTLNLLKQAAKSHQVDLACFSFEANDMHIAEGLKKFGITPVLVPAREPTVLKKAITVLVSPGPYSVAKYYSLQMGKVIEKLTNENTYDIVHCDHIHMAHYGKYFNGVPCLVDEHNVEFKILERCADVKKSLLKKIIFRSQARKMRRFEERKIAGISACAAVSENDSRILKALTRSETPVYTLPNGVDTEFYHGAGGRGQGSAEEDAVVFTGSMDWLPNDDAAIYFCKDILPLVWKTNPKVKFYIVGKGPSNRLLDLAKGDERIISTGRVDDVRAYVEKSKVFVVPLRIGGGTRLKILEAMSMQRAVVSTSIGAEGIAYSNDENIILADNPGEFAQKVIFLLENKAARERIAACGRKLVLIKYDWNVIGKILHKIYDDLRLSKK